MPPTNIRAHLRSVGRHIFLALVSLAAAATSSARAEPPKEQATQTSFPIEVGGSFWTRYELRNGYARLGRSRGRFSEGDFFAYRARLTLRTRPLDLGSGWRAELRFSPQADGLWGNLPGTVATPNLGIYEGFLRIGHDSLVLDIGHFAMNYGDAVVIGDLRWHQTARSFDGARVRFRGEGFWVDAFATYLDEGLQDGVQSILGGDVVFSGLYASLGGLISEGTVFEPYVLTQLWISDDGAQRPAVQPTFGVRAKQRFGIIDLRLEAGLQTGRRRAAMGANPEVFAGHVDVELGIKLGKRARVSLEGIYATGDDPNTATREDWDELFPTTHKFLGLMDIIGFRTNIASVVAHTQVGLGPVKVKLDLHAFMRPQTRDFTPGTPGGEQSSFAGVEGDLNVIYVFAKGLTLRGLYAVYVPGGDHFFVATDPMSAAVAVSDIAHYAELQFGLQI